MFTSKKEENSGGINNNILIAVIVALSIIIAVMWFFLWRMTSSNDKVVVNPTNGIVYEELTLKIITDKRDTETPVDMIVNQLKELPSIQLANIEELDFSDNEAKKLLEETDLKTLPAFIFSTNTFDVSVDPQQFGQDGQLVPKLNSYLQILPNGEYFLDVWATYDPYIERSSRGFKQITEEQYKEITWNSYIDWDINSKFVWIEYSDLECPYCAKFHNEGTTETVVWEYEWEIALIFKHFPLSFHNNAEDAAEALECLAEQKGSDAFYSLMRTSFANADFSGGGIDASKSSSKEFLITEAVSLWANTVELEKCISEWRYEDKINKQMNTWTNIFGITWTPGNVIINTETLEYEVISWAYPAQTFRDAIERLK